MDFNDISFYIAWYCLKNGKKIADVSFGDMIGLSQENNADGTIKRVWISDWNLNIPQPDLQQLINDCPKGLMENARGLWRNWWCENKRPIPVGGGGMSREEELLKRIEELEARLSKIEKIY